MCCRAVEEFWLPPMHASLPRPAGKEKSTSSFLDIKSLQKDFFSNGYLASYKRLLNSLIKDRLRNVEIFIFKTPQCIVDNRFSSCEKCLLNHSYNNCFVGVKPFTMT